jgi:membrane protein DedA with SNARE-associated domain
MRWPASPAPDDAGVPVIGDLLAWIQSLPSSALYLALAGAAAIENIFPPLPSDAVVAFGSFLAARGSASVISVFLATWLANVAGACAVYALARSAPQTGRLMMDRRSHRSRGQMTLEKLRAFHDRYGILALALSRFIPGARALVPPLAGAVRMPVWRFTLVVTNASGRWYGAITYLASRAGANWPSIQAKLTSLGRVTLFGALGIAAALLIVWLVRRRSVRP